MKEETTIRIESISDADLEWTPSSIKCLVKGLLERIGCLEQKIEELRRDIADFRTIAYSNDG
jgi:hypothetical protein